MSISLIGYVNILIGFIDIVLGFLVLRGSTSKDIKKPYFWSAFTMGLWSLALFLYGNPLFADSFFWLKIVYIASYLMTIAQMAFGIRFRKFENQTVKNLLLLILTPLFAFGLYLLFIKNSVVLDVYIEKGTSSPVAVMGKDYIWFLSPIIISVIFLLYIYLSGFKSLTGVKEKQNTYYFVASLLMVFPMVLLDIVFPIFFQNTEFYQYSTLGNILWVLIIGYSIRNTHFLDVRLVTGRVIETILKSSLLLVIFLFYTEWSRYNLVITSTEQIIALVVISLISSILLGFLNQRIEEWVQKKFIYSQYNPIEKIQEHSLSLARELNIQNILKKTSKLIDGTIHPKSSAILLFSGKDKKWMYEEKSNFPNFTTRVIEDLLVSWQNLNSNPVLVLSEMETDYSFGKEIIDRRKNQILSFMEEFNVEIIVPFELKSFFSGLIILGKKKDNSLYTQTDVLFLESLVGNTSIATERAILYEQVLDFNKTLKQKVNEQTQELQQKVLELEEARRKERDMIDIMGHELRTPATIVKLNAELLEKYIESNPENFKKYLDRIQNSIENEIRLIDTLLSSAKLEGQKIEMNKERVSVPEQIEVVLHGYEYQAEAKGLKLISDIDEDTKDVYADKVRVGEIIDNLVSNAIKYTDEGSIIVKTESTDDHVKVSVIDTGKGIPEEEIPKLGTKFHRIEHYISGEDGFNIVRPGGTGLGLYVVYALVEMMGGKIWVDTEVGKGTTFFFTLPVYKGQREDIVSTNSKNMFDKFGLKK